MLMHPADIGGAGVAGREMDGFEKKLTRKIKVIQGKNKFILGKVQTRQENDKKCWRNF